MPSKGRKAAKTIWSWEQDKGKLLSLAISLPAAIVAVLTLAHYSAPEKKFGACGISLQTPANVKRLNGYIEEGQQLAAEHSHQQAADRFKQVVEIDPNYLGAHQDLGVVQLAQGDYAKAQDSFNTEINLIDCLRSVKPADLHRFAYFLGKNQENAVSEAVYSERLDAAEDSAHYNLACALAKQGVRSAALNELTKASEHHSIKRTTVARDPDLGPLRDQVGYQVALTKF